MQVSSRTPESYSASLGLSFLSSLSLSSSDTVVMRCVWEGAVGTGPLLLCGCNSAETIRKVSSGRRCFWVGHGSFHAAWSGHPGALSLRLTYC